MRLKEAEDIISNIIDTIIECPYFGKAEQPICDRVEAYYDEECLLCKKMYNYIKKYNINKFLF